MPCLRPVWMLRVDAVGLVLADQVLDGRRDHHHLVGGDQRPRASCGSRACDSTPMRAVESCVRIWSCCSLGKTSMMRLIGAGGPVGVQRAEDDVAGLGRLDGRVDRLQVAHFADEDDVGVHAQGPADALREVGHVDADLALVDRALLVLVVVLDRVFDRDDVPVVVVVEEVDHAGQAGRLARAGRPGDQQQAARPDDEPRGWPRACRSARR